MSELLATDPATCFFSSPDPELVSDTLSLSKLMHRHRRRRAEPVGGANDEDGAAGSLGRAPMGVPSSAPR